MFNRLKKLRIIKPFCNRNAAGLVSTISLILGIFSFMIIVTWCGLRGIESFAQSRVDTLCYKLVDAVASSGELNDGIQSDLYDKFNKLNFYSKDYKIEFYKYTYDNYFSKEYLGSSDNGSKLPTIELNRGEMIQVIYTSESTTLDSFNEILDPGSVKIGLSGESSMKVD